MIDSAHAHGGGLDNSGGHNCYVGSCAGTYHYHRGGSDTADGLSGLLIPAIILAWIIYLGFGDYKQHLAKKARNAPKAPKSLQPSATIPKSGDERSIDHHQLLAEIHDLEQQASELEQLANLDQRHANLVNRSELEAKILVVRQEINALEIKLAEAKAKEDEILF